VKKKKRQYLLEWLEKKYPNKEDFKKLTNINYVDRNSPFEDVEILWDNKLHFYSQTDPSTKLPFPLINTDDLTKLAYSLTEENSQDPEFMKKFGIDESKIKILRPRKDKAYIMLDNLANQILARCIIAADRLTHGKDEEFEENVMSIAFDFQRCGAIPEPRETDQEKLEAVVDKALNGDKELLQKLADLPYIAEWVKEKLKEEE